MVDGIPRTLSKPGAVILAGPPVIRFAADGSASGGAVSVTEDTLAMVVTVEWLTGRVVVADMPAHAR